ncbi:MAG: hypothetical protein L6W00_28680 [Lentisphaeria bacterium]|nr:MAG: hypothetical protein L6W00_28680 [Lentisphaeria bacterium]
MKYELTNDEERELNQELERSRKMLESMNCTREYINHELKKVRSKFLSRIAGKRFYRKKKIENLKAHRILKRESAVIDLLDRTFDILFPPEDHPHIPPETKLLNAVYGRRANVPFEVAREFVSRVICDAERLVREYNSSEDEK